jgi:transcriptional regulator with XRE-family HTH domain
MHKEVYMHIGEKIKKIRESKSLTQAQLAKRAGIGQPYISKIENQTMREPPMSTIESIAMALEMDGLTLVEGTSFNPEAERALQKKGVGFCPNSECPGSNFPEIEESEARGYSNLPPWEPYKTPLLDEDGESIHFCVHCGNKLVIECQHCGRGIKRFYRYCPGCGQLLFRQTGSSLQTDTSNGEEPIDDDDVPF